MKPKWTRPLKWGVVGDDVQTAHDWLQEIFFFWKDKTQVSTGKSFTFTTQQAVRNFQKRMNLPVTGVIDKKTWDMMDYCMGFAIASYK